jgi:hypothetical protein
MWQPDGDVTTPLCGTARVRSDGARLRCRFPGTDSSTTGEKERSALLDAESIEDCSSFPCNPVECSGRWGRGIVIESDSCRSRNLWRQQGGVVYRSRIDSQETRQSRGVLHPNDALGPRDSLKDFRIGVDELPFRSRQVIAALSGEERNSESYARERSGISPWPQQLWRQSSQITAAR